MATLRTRAQLRSGARALADAENDRNVGDTLLNGWIDDAIRELWRAKVDVDPDTYAIRTAIATTSGTQSYSLPSDFMQIRRVDRVTGTNTYDMIVEAPPLLELDFNNTNSGEALQYRVMGGGALGLPLLWLLPDPGTASYAVWYAQSPQPLAADGTNLDCTHGEDRYVQSAVAARIAKRQDRDPIPHLTEQAEALASMKTSIAKRSSGRPKRITDTRSQQTGFRKYPRP